MSNIKRYDKINKPNNNKIENPPILAIGSLWNACGLKKSLSRRDPEKKFLEYFAIKKVVKKLIKEKMIKKFKLNSDNIIYCIFLLYIFPKLLLQVKLKLSK